MKVGLVAKTRGPDPVSSVTADARFADDGVAKNVATPDPRPLTPVLIGNPVAFVRVPDDGVPNAPPLTTKAPDDPTLMPSAVVTPVPSAVRPVPPLATANVPDIVIVPDVVMGPPENDRPVEPPLTSTLVTVPSGLVAHDVFEPSVVRYLPLLPP